MRLKISRQQIDTLLLCPGKAIIMRRRDMHNRCRKFQFPLRSISYFYSISGTALNQDNGRKTAQSSWYVATLLTLHVVTVRKSLCMFPHVGAHMRRAHQAQYVWPSVPVSLCRRTISNSMENIWQGRLKYNIAVFASFLSFEMIGGETKVCLWIMSKAGEFSIQLIPATFRDYLNERNKLS